MDVRRPNTLYRAELDVTAIVVSHTDTVRQTDTVRDMWLYNAFTMAVLVNLKSCRSYHSEDSSSSPCSSSSGRRMVILFLGLANGVALRFAVAEDVAGLIVQPSSIAAAAYPAARSASLLFSVL